MTKLTPQELDERIDAVLYSMNRDRDLAKQLIRDCIEAVKPEGRSYPANLNGSLKGQGFADAIDTIQANTKELLG